MVAILIVMVLLMVAIANRVYLWDVHRYEDFFCHWGGGSSHRTRWSAGEQLERLPTWPVHLAPPGRRDQFLLLRGGADPSTWPCPLLPPSIHQRHRSLHCPVWQPVSIPPQVRKSDDKALEYFFHKAQCGEDIKELKDDFLHWHLDGWVFVLLMIDRAIWTRSEPGSVSVPSCLGWMLYAPHPPHQIQARLLGEMPHLLRSSACDQRSPGNFLHPHRELWL